MTSSDFGLQITITDAEANGEQLEKATFRLMTELRDVGVESVNRATMTTRDGTKAGVALAPGAMNVAIQPGLIDRLFHHLNAWTKRGQQRTVKVKTPDGIEIEFTPDKPLSPVEMLAFIRALRSETQTDAVQPGIPFPPSRYRIPLRELLIAHFDESELQTLCFYLSIPYEDLSGQNRSDKINALITYAERHQRIDDLLNIGRQLRQDVPWQCIENV